MSEVREYHELLLSVIRSLQRQVDRLQSDLASSVSTDKVAALERRIEALETLIKELTDKLDEERRLSLTQRVKLAVYIGITVAVLGLVGAMTVDLWKQAILPSIKGEKSEGQ